MCLGESFCEVLAKASAGDESLCESVCVGSIAEEWRGGHICMSGLCLSLCAHKDLCRVTMCVCAQDLCVTVHACVCMCVYTGSMCECVCVQDLCVTVHVCVYVHTGSMCVTHRGSMWGSDCVCVCLWISRWSFEAQLCRARVGVRG